MTDGTDPSGQPSATPGEPSPPRPPRPPRVAAPAEGGWGRRLTGRHRRLTVLGVLVTALLLFAAGAVAVGLLDEQTQDEPAGLCLSTRSVEVVADPTLAPSLQRVADRSRGTVLSTGMCADVTVVARDSAAAAAALAGAGDTGRRDEELPELWVPDSSVWLGRAVADPPVPGVELTALGSLVSSPLVVAAGPEVLTEAGWAEERPTWRELLTSERPLASAELVGSAASVQALVALQSTLPDAAEARTALAQAAAALQRGTVDDAAAALALAGGGGADAPLVPTTEQQVFTANRGSTATDLVAVQPADGPTSLDYPVVRVDTTGRGAEVDAAAVEGVVRLLETAGREAALADGFRPPLPVAPGAATAASATPEPTGPAGPEPSGSAAPEQSGPATSSTADEQVPGAEGLVVPVPRSSDVDVLLAQLAELNRPNRVLAVLDASTSMRGVTASGATRAEVVQQAVTGTVAAFGDSSSAGLWFFGAGLGGANGYAEIVPLRALDPAVAGVDQRAELAAGAATLDARLVPGGTGLLDATLAAVRALQQDHDPEAATSVLLVTDGRQEGPGGIGLEELVSTLRAEADPERPVRVLPIGIGADVSTEELRAIAEATGGSAYLAEAAEDFPTVLTDALRRR